MPVASCAISPACGAGSVRPPMPPFASSDWCSTMIGIITVMAVRITAAISTTSIFHGVPRSKCPALRSWMSEPEVQQAQHTTLATPSTAATPAAPFAPSASITRAARISAESVRPDTGWLDPPTSPTRYPPTADSTNPATVMMTAAASAEAALPVK